MTNRLLTLTAAAALCLAAQAADWTAPELPTEASTTLVSGNSYQIRNTASNMSDFYLSWGAVTWDYNTALQLVERTETSTIITYKLEQTTDGWTMLNEATNKYTFVAGILGESDGENLSDFYGYGKLYVDMADQGHNVFSITPSTGNAYRIQIAASDDTYGEQATAGKYLGWIDNVSATDLVYAVYAFLDPTEEHNCCDWELVDMTTYNARLNLYNALLEADEAGISTTSAGAVYENSSSSVDNLKEAYNSLKEALAEQVVGKIVDGTANDVTALIENADFSDGTLSPWVSTTGKLVYDSSTYPNSDCNVTDLNDNYTYNHWAAAWQSSSSGGLADDNVYQTIAWVPAGTYKLTCDMVAQHNEDMPEGVFLYETNNGETKELECKHDETQWAELVAAGTYNQLIMHPTLTFKVETAGELTVGVKMVSTNCNWVYFSNFKLTYYGETDASEAYLALEAAIEEAKAYLDTETYYYSASGLSTLTQAVNTAENALTGSDEEMEAAQTALEDAVSVAKADIQAYSDFAAYLQELLDAQADFAGGYDDIAGELSDKYDELKDAYDARETTVEAIEEEIDGYTDWLRELVTDAMPEASTSNPLNITSLCTNMNYANNTNDGWTLTRSGGSNQVTYHCAEVWNGTFTELQTLADMPAGSYMLKAKAFYRTSTTADSYAAYVGDADAEEILTYLVVADGSAQVVNIAAGAISGLTDETAPTGYAAVGATDYPGVYQPNTMQAAEYAFNLNDAYECQATGYLVSDGDLTFGLRNDGPIISNAWSIWSQLRLYYCGEDINQLYLSMLALADEAEELDNEAGLLVAEADTKLQAAIAASEDCSDTDEDAIYAVIDQLNEAIAYGKESIELYDELSYSYTLYSDYVMTDDRLDNCDDSDWDDLLDDIASVIGDTSSSFESNAEIEKYISDLKTGFTAYVISGVDMDSATEDNPVDITPALLNSNFDGYGMADSYTMFWTLDVDGGTNGSKEDTSLSSNNTNAYECYNNTFFQVSQTVEGLPEGYYRVRVQGFYRAGTNVANADSIRAYGEEYGQNVILMANVVARPICNVIDGGMTTDPGITDESSEIIEINGTDTTFVYVPNTMESFLQYVDLNADVEDYYWTSADVGVTDGTLTVGLRKETHIDSDWTIWNNFELLYLGTEMPTGIEDLQGEGAGKGASDADVVLTQVFTVDGTQLSRPAKGINILRKTHADGSVSVEKVLVK
ncbi:MAG: hypothetical protein LUC33_05835 [Prevotellaceae bacterium]|nr:hypothetical protein [Prevotellaceae bacterium]